MVATNTESIRAKMVETKVHDATKIIKCLIRLFLSSIKSSILPECFEIVLPIPLSFLKFLPNTINNTPYLR